MGRFSNALKQIESNAPLKLTLAAGKAKTNASAAPKDGPQTIAFTRTPCAVRTVEEKPKREPQKSTPPKISLTEIAETKPASVSPKKAKSISPLDLTTKPSIELATPIAAPSSKVTLATSRTIHTSVGPAFVSKALPQIAPGTPLADNYATTTVTVGITLPSEPPVHAAAPVPTPEKREEPILAPSPAPTTNASPIPFSAPTSSAAPSIGVAPSSPQLNSPILHRPAAQPVAAVPEEPIRHETISDFSNSIAKAVEEKIDVIDSGLHAISGGASVFDEIAEYLAAQNRDRLPAALFFTSPTPNEGTTRTIIPLAEALSRVLTVETLLIDANVRRPDLTRRWGLFEEDDVRRFWSGEIDWRSCVRRSNQSRVHLLPNATVASKKSTGVSLEAVRRSLKEMKSRYPLILIDGPDLTRVETAPLASLCDATYLTVRLGKSTRRTVIEARDALEETHAVLRGCVVLGDE